MKNEYLIKNQNVRFFKYCEEKERTMDGNYERHNINWVEKLTIVSVYRSTYEATQHGFQQASGFPLHQLLFFRKWVSYFSASKYNFKIIKIINL